MGVLTSRLQMFGLKLNKYMSNFHLLEVVGRDSETRRQVGENLNEKVGKALTFLRVCSFTCM